MDHPLLISDIFTPTNDKVLFFDITFLPLNEIKNLKPK